jgi:hypothetical protein
VPDLAVSKPLNVEQLLAELAAAGHPHVSLRVIDQGGGTSALSAEGVAPADLAAAVAAHTAAPPAPNPDDALDAALASATTVAQMKAAMRAWVAARKHR